MAMKPNKLTVESLEGVKTARLQPLPNRIEYETIGCH